MRIWIITSRAFLWGDYFHRLESTKVAKTEEEAKKLFDKECSSQGDWFWDGTDRYQYTSDFIDENTYQLVSEEAMCCVTLREVEI